MTACFDGPRNRLSGFKAVNLLALAVVAASCGLAQSTLPGNSPNTTVFIGDSITAFGNAPETNPDQSYGWGWTAQAVFLSNGQIEQLYNAGSPGQTSAQIAARFATDVVAYNPGSVVIMAGTNDASTGALSANGLASVVTNLKSMIHQAKQAGIQPVICTIPPRGDAANYNRNVQQINGAIHKLAQAERIVLVDFYSILVDPATGVYRAGYDMGDGIHPSAKAAKAMAQYFLTATSDLYGPPQISIIASHGDGTNLIANPLFLYSTSGWTGNSYGSSPAPTYATVADSAISGNWFSMTFPPATSPGQYYAVNGPAAIMTPNHHMAYSFKFQITGLEANGGRLNMGYAWGASNFTYGYLNDAAGTFYIEFTASSGTFNPGFFLYPSVTAGNVKIKIAQMSLVDLTNLGY